MAGFNQMIVYAFRLFKREPSDSSFSSTLIKYQKWLNLTGLILLIIPQGAFFTIGNLSPYLISYFRESKGFDLRYAHAVWVTSAFTAFQTIGIIISSVMLNRSMIGERALLHLSSGLTSLAVISTHFAVKTSFAATVTTYGGLYGLACGLGHQATFNSTTNWLREFKNWSRPLIFISYGVSIAVINLIQTLTLNPSNQSPDKSYSDVYQDEKYFSKENHSLLLRKMPGYFFTSGIIFAFVQFSGLLIISEPVSSDQNSQTEAERLSILNPDFESFRGEENSIGVKYKSKYHGMSWRDALTRKEFWFLSVILNFSSLPAYLIITFYKIFGYTFINDDLFITLTGSVSCIYECIGYMFWEFMVNKSSAKSCHLVLDGALVIFGSSFNCLKLIGNKELLIIWLCAIYFIMSAIGTVTPVMIERTFGHRNLVTINGLIIFQRVFVAILSIWLGVSKDTMGWFWFFFINSCFSLVALVFTFLFHVTDSKGNDV